MNKPATRINVIALCAFLSLSVLHPNSQAARLRGTIALDETGAVDPVAKLNPTPDPVVRPTSGTDLQLNPVPSPIVIRPASLHPISVTPTPDPIVIRPSN